MIRRPPRSTQSRSSAASDVYKRQHHFFGLFHSRRCCDLMRRLCINDKKVTLNAFGIHGFSRTTSHNQVLLVNESLADGLSLVMTAMTIFARNVNASLDEVEPSEKIFGPEFEAF